MIKAEYGEVMVKGTGAEVLADFTAVIRAMKAILMETLTEEEAREEIAFIIQELAFRSDAEFEVERIGRRYEN